MGLNYYPIAILVWGVRIPEDLAPCIQKYTDYSSIIPGSYECCVVCDDNDEPFAFGFIKGLHASHPWEKTRFMAANLTEDPLGLQLLKKEWEELIDLNKENLEITCQHCGSVMTPTSAEFPGNPGWIILARTGAC